MKYSCTSLYGIQPFDFPHHHDKTRGAFSPHARTLHELGELIRRAGQAAGFTPMSEFKVTSTHKKDGRGKIDWVWKKGDVVVAAFEIEGQDVEHRQNKGIDKDRQTLDAVEVRDAPVRAILLFQVDHDGTCKDDVAGAGRLAPDRVLALARTRCATLATKWQLPIAIERAWDQDLCTPREDGSTLLEAWIARLPAT